jgi:uncharacterized membrane protein YfcA
VDYLHILLLAAAGMLGGILSAVVGGASLVTYPALIASGVHPIAAAVCTNTSLVPSNFIAAIADRTQLPPLNRAFVGLIVASVIGAGLGAALLLMTPARLFEFLVPLLLGFATVMFALSDRIARWLRERAKRRGNTIQFSVTSLKMVLPVSFYGGYFGAGVGILLLGVLSVATSGNYRAANVTKNLVSSLNTFVAACVYVVQGAVLWPQTLALCMGTVAGGLIGSWIARVLPRQIVRVMVVGFGAALTATFVYRYWL